MMRLQRGSRDPRDRVHGHTPLGPAADVPGRPQGGRQRPEHAVPGHGRGQPDPRVTRAASTANGLTTPMCTCATSNPPSQEPAAQLGRRERVDRQLQGQPQRQPVDRHPVHPVDDAVRAAPCGPGVAVKTSPRDHARGAGPPGRAPGPRCRRGAADNSPTAGPPSRGTACMRQDGTDAPHPAGLPRPPRRRGAAHLGDDGARRRGGPPRRRSWSPPTATRAWPPKSSPSDGRLGERRLEELRESARALGVARVEHLGYADSGLGPQTAARPARAGSGSCGPTSRRPPSGWPTILREERADVLLTYDRNGGYGHRDHVKVHEVGARAAALAGTPRVPGGDRAPRHDLRGRSPSSAGSTASRRSSTPHRSSAPSARARRSRTASGSAATPAPSAPRCAPTPPRPPPTAAPTAPWRPSCASPARCSTWSSAASGSSTRRTRPGAPVSRDMFAGLA